MILKYELSFSARNCHFSSKSPLKVWIVIFESILSFSIQSVLSKCDFRIKIVNSPSLNKFILRALFSCVNLSKTLLIFAGIKINFRVLS